jgi:hypothetical protein
MSSDATLFTLTYSIKLCYMFRHTRPSPGNGPLAEWGREIVKVNIIMFAITFFVEIDKGLGIKELIINFGVECWSNTLKIADAVM